MENPFYVITKCLSVKNDDVGTIANCHFKGFYKGEKVKALKVYGTMATQIEIGAEYFLLLEFIRLDEMGDLWCEVIDLEKLDDLRIDAS